MRRNDLQDRIATRHLQSDSDSITLKSPFVLKNSKTDFYKILSNNLVLVLKGLLIKKLEGQRILYFDQRRYIGINAANYHSVGVSLHFVKEFII